MLCEFGTATLTPGSDAQDKLGSGVDPVVPTPNSMLLVSPGEA